MECEHSATGEPDSSDISVVSACRSSAAPNDDFVDVGHLQQFTTNGIEAGSSEQTRSQTADMRGI